MKAGSLYNTNYPGYSTRSSYKSGLRSPSHLGNISDRESISGKNKRHRIRKGSNGSIKSSKPMSKKRNMDYTDYTYREAVGRLKFLLAESYTPFTKPAIQYHKHIHDSEDDTDNLSIDRPALSEISKYLSPTYRGVRSSIKKVKPYSPLVKENYTPPAYTTSADYLTPSHSHVSAEPTQPPPEVLSFIEKQEDYIEQLEKESKFCRDELSHLLGKVRDVISENETLTEHARSDLAGLSSNKFPISSESDEHANYEKELRKREKHRPHLSGPNIIFESRISELEAELAQAHIDLKKVRIENEEFRRKNTLGTSLEANSDAYRKQIENLQRDKANLEETVRKLQNTVDSLKTESTHSVSKSQRSRDLADMAIFERTQADMEITRLKDELAREHERVRNLQIEMTRKITEERSNAERRYNYQVDQLGGDLSSQWEQASKLQLDLERQKRVESDLKRDIAQRNTQIDDLKAELKAKRSSYLSDLAQTNAEKQSLEQEITQLRLQLERAERQTKIETARLTAEINSLRQRLDRADADILHARRENLRLNDDVSNLEKELALGDLKTEVRPSRNDITKSIADMQQKHAGTVSELEEMVQNQRQLMDKLTSECKTLTDKLEETSLKHNEEKKDLRRTNEMLMDRLRQVWASYKSSSPQLQNYGKSSDTEASDREEQNTKKQHHSSTTYQAIPTTDFQYLTPEETIHRYQNLCPTSSNRLISETAVSMNPVLVTPANHTMPTTKMEFPTEILLPKSGVMKSNPNNSSYLQKIRNHLARKSLIREAIRNDSLNQLNQNMQINSNQNIQKDMINSNTKEMNMKVNTTQNMISNTKANNSSKSTDKTPIRPTSLMLTSTHNQQQQSQQLQQCHQQLQQYQQQQQEPPNQQYQHQPPNQHHQDQYQRHQSHQNQKSSINRERAAALWASQIPESETKDQIFFRNSLPRQRKDFQVPRRTSQDEIDPVAIMPESNVSSPSLFEKSFSDSDDSTISLSLAQTAIEQL